MKPLGTEYGSFIVARLISMVLIAKIKDSNVRQIKRKGLLEKAISISVDTNDIIKLLFLPK
jgi:hypothetical protein